MTLKHTDNFGFVIEGIRTSKTKEEMIESLERHYSLLEGLTNEALSDIENRISSLKYDK